MKGLLLNAPVIESSSHKVVLVIDRSPKFAEPLHAADIPFCVKDDQNLPINGKLEKKLWNCSVEAIMEFHRVVTDLFPGGDKYLRFVISDFVGRFLTPEWTTGTVISHEQLLQAFALCDQPQGGGDASSCSIFNGILLGLEALSEQTTLQKKTIGACRNLGANDEFGQKEKRVNVAEAVRETRSDEGSSTGESPLNTTDRRDTSQEEGEIREATMMEVPKMKTKAANSTNNLRIRNRGSMLVLTMIDSYTDFEAINEYVIEQILALNETSRNTAEKKSMSIDHVNLFVLNVVPPNSTSKPLFGKRRRYDFHSKLITVKSGHALMTGVHKVLQDIYGLVSTTVCGIPMKEEAQSGQSVNYDVEMLHPLAAHAGLQSLGLLVPGSKLVDNASSHGNLFTSIRLKWCTANPKLKSEMFPLLHSSFPITPAHVNLRQTVCLTSFITNGKSVLLEIFPDAYQGFKTADGQKLGPNLQQKLISHYLSRDVNGALIFHCVAMGEKANLGGKLCSARVHGPKDCSSELAKSLNRGQFQQIVKAAQIWPNPNEQFQMVEEGGTSGEEMEQEGPVMRSLMLGKGNPKARERNGGNEDGEECDELETNVELLLGDGDMPVALVDSFIYNTPEKFESLLTTLTQPIITEEQFGQCKVQMISLIASMGKGPLTEKVFECKLLSTGKSDIAPRDEQYRVAFDELGRMLHRFAHLSPIHHQLLTVFTELSGIRPMQGQKRKRELSPAIAPSMGAKRAKKKNLWEPGEKMNVYEWLRDRYDKKYWTSWKGEFAIRDKHGDKAQEYLYPNLKLPPGQAKYAGTGGAGPIE